MYAKLKDGQLIPAPPWYSIDGKSVFTNRAETHLAQGYKEVIYTPPPEQTSETGGFSACWIETPTQIVREWLPMPEEEGDV